MSISIACCAYLNKNTSTAQKSTFDTTPINRILHQASSHDCACLIGTWYPKWPNCDKLALTRTHSGQCSQMHPAIYLTCSIKLGALIIQINQIGWFNCTSQSQGKCCYRKSRVTAQMHCRRLGFAQARANLIRFANWVTQGPLLGWISRTLQASRPVRILARN